MPGKPRAPELIIVDKLRDKHGRTVKVGHRGADVEIIVTPHTGHDGRIALDGEGRDRFIKAWADAEIAAERYLCQAHSDDCPNGPEPHPFVPPTAPDDVLPCCRQPWEADESSLRGRATAAGRDVVEQAARELIGIPDIL